MRNYFMQSCRESDSNLSHWEDIGPFNTHADAVFFSNFIINVLINEQHLVKALDQRRKLTMVMGSVNLEFYHYITLLKNENCYELPSLKVSQLVCSAFGKGYNFFRSYLPKSMIQTRFTGDNLPGFMITQMTRKIGSKYELIPPRNFLGVVNDRILENWLPEIHAK